MKRLLFMLFCVALFVVPMRVLGVADSPTTHTYSSGTSMLAIVLNGNVWSICINPLDADIVIEITDNSVITDTYTIKKGSAPTFYVAGDENIMITRATATVVNYVMSKNKYVVARIGVAPDSETMGTAIDSMVVLANSPTPVTFSANNTILTIDVVRSDFTAAGPQTGLYIEGAQGVLVICTYDSLRGRSAHKFTVEQHFVGSSGDTTSLCMDVDSFTVDNAVYGSDTGSLTWFLPLPENNQLFPGYCYWVVDSHGVITLRNCQISARLVY